MLKACRTFFDHELSHLLLQIERTRLLLWGRRNRPFGGASEAVFGHCEYRVDDLRRGS